MPPKGHKSVTVPDSFYLDLEILRLEKRLKTVTETVIRLYRFYRFGENF
jgi:hypothetical protein